MADFRKTFKNVSVFMSKIAEGQQGIVDKHRLLYNPQIQLPDLSGTRNLNLQFVAVKNFFSDDHGHISEIALRELHAFYLMMGCANIVQLLDVTSVIIHEEVVLRVMMPYHTSDLATFIKVIPFIERIKYAENIINQLLTGLYQLYYRGIIHRDIKPDNILMDYEYGSGSGGSKELLFIPQVYIADFGLSIQLPCDRHYRNIDLSINVYTPAFRPPEILGEHSNYTDKADIWAMGITLLEYFISKI